MRYTLLFTGQDNISHFKEIDADVASKQPLGDYSKQFPVKAMQFRDFEPNAIFPMHTAPCRQYIVYLEGNVEVEASDGEKRIFGPGDVLFATDTTGVGHITKTLTKGKSIIVIAED